MIYRVLKRSIDVFAALAGLIVLAPLLAAIAIFVRVKLGSPILFRQLRPGLLGQPFTLCKFRTMLDTRDSTGRLLRDEQRTPWLGKVLRSTSLDELPELWHVLRGDMSLVGPRPLLMEYLDHYSTEERRRHEMRPGITGWAQVNGRNELSWEEKLALDVWYVEHASLWLDLKILWKTLGAVLSRRGIPASDKCWPPLMQPPGSESEPLTR